MTSEEIKQFQASDISTNSWLREICLQLARLNERHAEPPAPAKPMRKVS